MGIPAAIFVPAAPRAKLVQALMYGAQVFAVQGSYDDAFELCLQACVHAGAPELMLAVVTGLCQEAFGEPEPIGGFLVGHGRSPILSQVMTQGPRGCLFHFQTSPAGVCCR